MDRRPSLWLLGFSPLRPGPGTRGSDGAGVFPPFRGLKFPERFDEFHPVADDGVPERLPLFSRRHGRVADMGGGGVKALVLRVDRDGNPVPASQVVVREKPRLEQKSPPVLEGLVHLDEVAPPVEHVGSLELAAVLAGARILADLAVRRGRHHQGIVKREDHLGKLLLDCLRRDSDGRRVGQPVAVEGDDLVETVPDEAAVDVLQKGYDCLGHQ